MNLARLNHILIPQGHAERQRWRRGRTGRLLLPLGRFFERTTLRGRVLVLLVMLAGALGLPLELSQLYVVFALLAGIGVAAALATPAFSLSDVHVAVQCARRVALGEPLVFSVEITNRGAEAVQALRVEAPFLPWDGRWVGRVPVLPVLPPGGTASVPRAGRFASRGEHHLDPFSVSALLPLGLSSGGPLDSPAVRFLVVPPIAPVARLALPLARRHQPGGVALASRTGESMDLLGVRPYRPGDPIRDLHARSWARVGVPIVREYQEEYFSRVGVVVDVDAGADRERALEAALSLAAGVVARLTRGDALIDLLVVGDEIHALTLGRSLGTLDQALDLLACVRARPGFDAEALARRLGPFLERLSCLLVVALDWDAPRVRFARLIEAQGVPCRSYVVRDPARRRWSRSVAPGPPLPGGDAVVVPVDAIERKEPLSL